MLSVSGPKVCGGGGGCWVCKLISVLSFVQAEQWFGHKITQRPILIAKTPLLNKKKEGGKGGQANVGCGILIILLLRNM